MAETRDVVIIGAGHNGLVTAFYLAKAGLKPLVLERRPQVGGCAITNEFHPGFRCSTLAHATGPVRTDVVSDMNLASHGLKTYEPDVRVLSLSPDGHHLALFSDAGRTQQEISKYSTKEAANYAEFQKALASIAAVVDHLLRMTPPDIDAPASGNVFDLLNTGRKIRGLDEKDFYRLLRWMPMAAADLGCRVVSTPNCCAPPSRHKGSSEPPLAPGLPDREPRCCCGPPLMAIPQAALPT